MPPDEDPPADVLSAQIAKALAHLAKSCLTPGEQMRVMARRFGIGKVMPQPSLFTKANHTYTDQATFHRRVAQIERAKTVARRNASRTPIIRRSSTAASRRPRQHRRVRPSGTRGQPAGAAGASSRSADDEPAPPGLLRVGRTWRWARLAASMLAALWAVLR